MQAFEFEAFAGAANCQLDLSVVRESNGKHWAIFNDSLEFVGYRAKDARNNFIIPYPRIFALRYGNGNEHEIKKGDRIPQSFVQYLKPFDETGLIEAPADW